MATFVSTIQFSSLGRKEIKMTCQRAEQFKAAVAGMGVNVRNIFWTLGAFDGLVVFDAPDDETATAAILQLESLGNVDTQTVRAFEAKEMEQIIGKLST